jgi:hypothetical protein
MVKLLEWMKDWQCRPGCQALELRATTSRQISISISITPTP